MSNEIITNYDAPGSTKLYAVVIDAAGQYWNADTQAFEAFNAAHWHSEANDSYAIALAEAASGTCRYAADFPSNGVPAGLYAVEIYEKVGASPAPPPTDGFPYAIGEVNWDGSALVVLPRITASSGVVESNLKEIGGGAINDYNATLKLKCLDIRNDGGTAVYMESLGGNGAGLAIGSAGTQPAMYVVASGVTDALKVQSAGGAGTSALRLVDASGMALSCSAGQVGSFKVNVEGDLTGKLLGTTSGGGTISGAGARVVDANGNAIATESGGNLAAIKLKTDNLPAAFPANFADLAIAQSSGEVTATGGAGGVTPEEIWSYNVDSTGVEQGLSAAKALEATVAVLAGKASFDPSTGVEVFNGRDGSTIVVSNTLTGSGLRVESSVA